MRRNIYLQALMLVGFTLLALPLEADVTLVYKSDVALNPNLPPQIAQQMMASMSVSVPPASTQQFRNGKLLFQSGKQNSILDLAKREITLLDNEGKRYATVPLDRYGDEVASAMPAVPSAAQAAMAALKGHSEVTSTGRTATIQGVEAEERNIVFTIDGAIRPGMPDAPIMRMVLHLWLAKASEATRVEAIREVTGYDLFAVDGLNPLSTMQKAFQQIPGIGDAFAGLMKDMQSGGRPFVLRTQIEVFMPLMKTLMQRMPAGAASPFGANFDPDAALSTMTQELTEMSTAPIADAVFEVPEGYQPATVAEILKALTARPTSVGMRGASGTITPAPTKAIPAPAATAVKQPAPVYPPEARAAGIQGTVTFDATIGKDGAVKGLQLISGPPLLVQAALEAARQWVYRPTLRDGEPVEVLTKIEVNFSLTADALAPPAQ